MGIVDPTIALIFLTFLGIAIVVLNVFSFIVLIRSKRRKRLSTIPIFWMLAANILIGMFPVPIYGLKKYELADDLSNGKVCDAWRYSYFLCIHLALASLFFMTFEKIYVLVFPLRYKEFLNGLRLNLVLMASWLFFVVFDFLPFLPFNEMDREYCHYVVKKEWALAMNILTMAIPLPLITASYVYMVYLAYVQSMKIQRSNKISDRNNTKRSKNSKIIMALEIKATRTVAVVVGAYILCWAPATLYYLLVWLCPSCYPEYYEPHKTWIKFFFKLLNLFHAFITPIIFCCKNKEFRKEVKTLVNQFKSSKKKTSQTNVINHNNTFYQISKLDISLSVLNN